MGTTEAPDRPNNAGRTFRGDQPDDAASGAGFHDPSATTVTRRHGRNWYQAMVISDPYPAVESPMHLVLFALLAPACAGGGTTPAATSPANPSEAATGLDPKAPAQIPAVLPGQAEAVLAGGCFWCLESDFDKLAGVVHTTSGYAGGTTANPTYTDIGTGSTGHAEVVRVVYDTNVLSYGDVVDYFLHHIDPTDNDGQFCDRGNQYRSAIFPTDDSQRVTAQAAIDALSASGVLPGPVRTKVEPTATFTSAENYHQDFKDSNPARYYPYRMGCGRDARVAKVWAGQP
jgi:peptide-methionine (S)-S-oxide reductase